MVSYKARENDIVDSQLELQQSLINTLATFFDVLVTKLQYKISLASSITTQDGTTQRAQTFQAQIGQYKNGAPKYKTIVNKFLVLDVYISLPGQSRKKITRLTLAPINVLNYSPKNAELELISKAIGQILNTGAMQITAPNTPTNTFSTAPTVSNKPVPVPQGGPTAQYQADGTPVPTSVLLQNLPPNATQIQGAAAPVVVPAGFEIPPPGTRIMNAQTGDILGTADGKTMYEKAKPVSDGRGGLITQGIAFEYPAGYVQGTWPPKIKTGAEAANLTEWYQANNQSLPTVAERSLIYENLGLGHRASYAGTTEQNITLLAKLKAQT